jgi:hypothetical protein
MNELDAHLRSLGYGTHENGSFNSHSLPYEDNALMQVSMYSNLYNAHKARLFYTNTSGKRRRPRGA